jgi:hypothetical protein
MISVTVVFTQSQAQQARQAPAAPATPAPPDPAQLREQIRQSIEAARQATQQAQQQSRVTIDRNGIIVHPEIPGEPNVFVSPRDVQNMIPPQVVDMSIAFFMMVAFIVVGFPIARAFGRRIDRRSQVAALDSGTMEQLQRIEQAVDAMSIEVERISESQRFMARLQHDASAHALPGTEPR